MQAEISKIADTLINAVQINSNVYSSPQTRVEAYKYLEEFKEHSVVCAACGFELWKKSDPFIRHFGLKLIVHQIKIRWNQMEPQEKVEVKDGTLKILSTDLKSVTKEEVYIKDVLSQIVVEIIKREWPQQWPTLLSELNELCSIGAIQKELVLLILLRLAEDIVQFQALPDQRRKDIYRTLCSSLKELVEFFITVLNEEYIKYSTARGVANSGEEAQAHLRIVQVALETLSSYAEWVPTVHISQNISLFYRLCCLLNDNQVQFGAAKCLLQLVERKGKVEDRKPVLVLFEDNSMSAIFSAFSSSDTLNERHYLFLKQLCQVLAVLGIQLASMWGIVDDVKEPATFPTYLNCLLAITKHPSLVISQSAQSLWITFFRHAHIPQTASMQQILSDLLKTEMLKLKKIGLPSHTDSVESEYSRLEFDTDEQYGLSFSKYRGDVMDVVKQISILVPETAFGLGSFAVLSYCNGQEGKGYHLLWDMLSCYMDAVCTAIAKDIQNNQYPKITDQGVELLKLTLYFRSEDPVVLSASLSCMSAVLVFASRSPEILSPLLDKQPVADDPSMYKEFKNLRRHACVLLVKICQSNTKILVVAFDQMCQKIKELLHNPTLLSLNEKSLILEALIILSNEFCDYQKQLMFLNDVLIPVASMWTSESMKTALSTVENLIKFFGLHDVFDDPVFVEAIMSNKRNVRFCTEVMNGCIKRCKWPDDVEVAKQNGFLHPSNTALNSTFLRNPLSEPLIPLLNGVFILIRTIHRMYEPSSQAKIHPSYNGVLDISELDKNSILGVKLSSENSEFKDSSALEKTKFFLNTLYESCLHILGRSCEFLGPDFYLCPDLANAINSNLVLSIECLPDNQLKCFIQSFLRKFVLCTPPFFFNDLIKVLSLFCPFMYQKLSQKWGNFKHQYGSSTGYEEKMTEIQEVLEDQINRQLTREYISFLGLLLHKKSGIDQNDDLMEEDAMEQNNSNGSDTLSELGIKALQSLNVRTSVVRTVFDALHWLDTVSASSSFRSCESILKQLVSNREITQESEASYLFMSVLYGLQELGEHEANQSALLGLGVKIYESLLPQFPCLNDVLHQYTSCLQSEINVFEKQIFKPNVRDRKKRDLLKNICSKILGKNIGQHYRHNIIIKDLPPLFVQPRPKNLPIDETGDCSGLCRLFAVPGPVS